MEISRRHLFSQEQEELREKIAETLNKGIEHGEAKRVYTAKDVVVMVNGNEVSGFTDDIGAYFTAPLEEVRPPVVELEGSTRNQRRVAMKRAKKAARKAK